MDFIPLKEAKVLKIDEVYLLHVCKDLYIMAYLYRDDFDTLYWSSIIENKRYDFYYPLRVLGPLPIQGVETLVT